MIDNPTISTPVKEEEFETIDQWDFILILALGYPAKKVSVTTSPNGNACLLFTFDAATKELAEKRHRNEPILVNIHAVEMAFRVFKNNMHLLWNRKNETKPLPKEEPAKTEPVKTE